MLASPGSVKYYKEEAHTNRLLSIQIDKYEKIIKKLSAGIHIFGTLFHNYPSLGCKKFYWIGPWF